MDVIREVGADRVVLGSDYTFDTLCVSLVAALFKET